MFIKIPEAKSSDLYGLDDGQILRTGILFLIPEQPGCHAGHIRWLWTSFWGIKSISVPEYCSV